MPYPELMVAPMRQDLKNIGFTELQTAAQVEEFMTGHQGIALLVINSVCGCAAGAARPAVAVALNHEDENAKPDQCVTVFAGQDVDATAKAREYFPPFPPSSPSFVIVKDGQPGDYIPRHRIEMRSPEEIAADINTAIKNLKG